MAVTLTSGPDDDSVSGGRGPDTISGGEGADSLKGGDGKDDIAGGPGEDTIAGSDGDDTIDTQDLGSGGIGERDLADCGPGQDKLMADLEDEFRRCEESLRFRSRFISDSSPSALIRGLRW